MNVIPLTMVVHKTNLSRPTIYRLIRAGSFPSPKKVGTRSVWDEEAVDSWLESLPSGTATARTYGRAR
jgi:prophage regulatory protein